MQATELTREGARVMSVCNACRYCEQYCPAFQAMEQRLTFATADLNYLANLCHGCGECLYACQYAPPHEFAINVPKTFAQLRVQSYEQYAWPAALGAAFRRQGASTALLLAGVMIVLLLGATLAPNGDALLDPGTAADFYAVVPHGVMVALFGGVGLFVLVALAIGAARCARELRTMHETAPHARTRRHERGAGRRADAESLARRGPRLRDRARGAHAVAALAASRDVLRLHAVLRVDVRRDALSPRRLRGAVRVLELARAARHGRRHRPRRRHGGLLLQRRRRDAALSDEAQEALDRHSSLLLLLTAVTGLLLLALRHERAMGLLLIVHLGVVLALFLTLPYGKFVHGLYRGIALLHYRRER